MTSFSSEYTEDEQRGKYGTPEYIVEPLADAVGGFDLDPAAGAEPTPYADERVVPGPGDTTTSGGGLDMDWHGDVWLNPPYGRAENPAWAEKVREQLGNVDSITCLIPSSTTAAWFQDTYSVFDYVALPGFRIEFVSGASFAPAGFDNMIAAYGDLPDDYPEALAGLSRPGEEDSTMVLDVRTD